jgi:hypothetical protein
MKSLKIPSGLKLEFVPYPDERNTGGRVWIGNIELAEVYQRQGGGDLFFPLTIKYEFWLKIFKKHQSPGQWLEHLDKEEYTKLVDTIEEGLEWILTKLKE